jgi:hypothetical protein
MEKSITALMAHPCAECFQVGILGLQPASMRADIAVAAWSFCQYEALDYPGLMGERSESTNRH